MCGGPGVLSGKRLRDGRLQLERLRRELVHERPTRRRRDRRRLWGWRLPGLHRWTELPTQHRLRDGLVRRRAMPDVLPSAPSALQRRVRQRTDEPEPLWRVRRGLLERHRLSAGPVRDGVRGRSALLRWRVRRLGLEPAPLRPVRQRVRRLGALRVRQLRGVVPTDDRALRRRVRLDAARRSALRAMRSNVWRGPVVPQRCVRDGMPCAAHRLRVRHVCRFEERPAPLRRVQPAVPAPSAEPACLRRERVRPGRVPARLRGLQRRRDGWL